MMTLTEAEYTIGRAIVNGLSGAEFLETLGPENVRRACNGIGPDRWPEARREKFNKWLWLFADPAAGHDCRFTFDNDGSEAKFRAANDELERNCLIVADATYRWYNPLRYLARRKGRLMAQACRDFGWRAWRAAYEKKQRKDNNDEKTVLKHPADCPFSTPDDPDSMCCR